MFKITSRIPKMVSSPQIHFLAANSDALAKELELVKKHHEEKIQLITELRKEERKRYKEERKRYEAEKTAYMAKLELLMVSLFYFLNYLH